MTRTAAQLIAEWRESQNNPLRVLVRKWRSGVPDAAAVEPYDAGKLICAFELEALLETADTGELASRINYYVETEIVERLRIAAERRCEVCNSLGHTTLEHGDARGYSYSVIPAAERGGPGELVAKLRIQAKQFINGSEDLANIGEAARANLNLTRGREIERCADEIESWWAERAGKPSCGNCGGSTEQAEDRHWYCANPDCSNCKPIKHIGWISGHCSDPMNCPACNWGAK